MSLSSRIQCRLIPRGRSNVARSNVPVLPDPTLKSVGAAASSSRHVPAADAAQHPGDLRAILAQHPSISDDVKVKFMRMHQPSWSYDDIRNKTVCGGQRKHRKLLADKDFCHWVVGVKAALRVVWPIPDPELMEAKKLLEIFDGVTDIPDAYYREIFENRYRCNSAKPAVPYRILQANDNWYYNACFFLHELNKGYMFFGVSE